MSRFQPYDEVDDSICEEYERICAEDGFLDTPIDLNDQSGNLVIVINWNSMWVFRLTPAAMECFRRTFPGRICNAEQWKYFVYLIQRTKKTTGVGRSRLNYVRLGAFSLE